MSGVQSGHSPKILLVAEHASATFGGEALIPFQYFKHLRTLGVDVHLLVHERTKKELQSEFPTDLDRLHFVSDSSVNILCHRLGRLLPDRLDVFTLGTLSHLETQLRQRRLARLLVQKLEFDIVHEPIPVSPKLPSMLCDLAAPVIIGPMNGGMDYPPHYNLAGRIERLAIFGFRSTAWFWNAVFPGKRNAAVLLVANKRTYNALPNAVRKNRVIEFVENGVDLDLFRPSSFNNKDQDFHIIYIGRLVDWKRVDLLIEACAPLLGNVNFTLHVVGDGPLRGKLEDQVEGLCLTKQVIFHGRVAQAMAADRLKAADIMVLPSMRECGGAVVLEAMASGIPVVATKWGGPSEYITPETGILIPPATPDVFVRELAATMLWMARNPEVRAQMAQAGRQRAETYYSWSGKARALLKIYEDVLSNHTRDD
jgi:glycosyltransferase involved in cell wall biosynthesis